MHTSKLSKAFDKVTGIRTVVDLSQFAHQRNMAGGRGDEPFEYREEESLVTSTKEFIDNIRRHVYKKFGKTKLHAEKPDHMLTLKVVGYREYLLGDYQLLHYERVR